jgi:hypothetical protein
VACEDEVQHLGTAGIASAMQMLFVFERGVSSAEADSTPSLPAEMASAIECMNKPCRRLQSMRSSTELEGDYLISMPTPVDLTVSERAAVFESSKSIVSVWPSRRRAMEPMPP